MQYQYESWLHTLVRERPKSEIDPTFRLCNPFVAKFKLPFVKRSLLTKREVSIKEALTVVDANNFPFDTDLMELN